MSCIKIVPKKLKGEVDIPPSKSMSHRAIIAACLAPGKSTVDNIILSNDIIATIDAMEKLGAKIHIYESKSYTGRTQEKYPETLQEDGMNPEITKLEELPGTVKSLEIFGIQNLDIKDDPVVLECNESGSTLRFLIPLAALFDSKIRFTGKGKLPVRPLDSYYEIFDSQNIDYINDKGNLPLTLSGKLRSGTFHVKGDISSQFISGLMFALPLLEGQSEIIMDSPLESKGYVDMTISVLSDFGIDIINHGYSSFEIPGSQSYKPRTYTTEGDFSQAAFWIVANALGSDIKISGLNEGSLQQDKKIVEIAEIFKEAGHIEIDAADIPDIIPVICVMASMRNGTTRIYNAARLRLKESDRITATVTELSKLGADIKEHEDTIIISGKNQLTAGETDSWGDHRIAMSLAIASTACTGEVMINGYEAVEKSYPDFWKDFERAGGILYECDDRKQT